MRVLFTTFFHFCVVTNYSGNISGFIRVVKFYGRIVTIIEAISVMYVGKWVVCVVVDITRCVVFPRYRNQRVFIKASTCGRLSEQVSRFRYFNYFFYRSSMLVRDLIASLPQAIRFISRTPYFRSM